MDYGFAENMVKFFTWIFIMFMVGHWNACILYLIPSAGPQAVQDLAHPDNPRWDGDQRGYGPGDSLDQSWIFSSGVHYKVRESMTSVTDERPPIASRAVFRFLIK